MLSDPHVTYIGFPHHYILVLTMVCAVTDLRSGRIYNIVTYPSILVGLVYNGAFGAEGAFISSAIGFVAGIAPFAFAASRGWIGAGDVKLFGAVGAVAGLFILLDVLLISFAIAALFGLSTLLLREGLTGTARRFFAGVRMLARGAAADDSAEQDGPHLRLGAFVFLGAAITVAGVWLRL